MLDPDTLHQIKRDLPDFPDDVIDVWLSTFVRRFGWPPEVHPGWGSVLKGTGDSDFLRSLKDWKLIEIEIDPAKFHHKDKGILVGLYRTHVLGKNTVFSLMTDGPKRFQSIVEYMRQNGVFPRPVVLASNKGTLDILDGYHRITAMMYLFGYFKDTDPNELATNVPIKQPAWLCQQFTA